MVRLRRTPMQRQDRQDTVWQDPTLVRTYLDKLVGGVPFGAAQLEIALRVIEARGEPVRNFVDLGCGGGAVAQALLSGYPQARATLVDFSEPMFEAARATLGRHDPTPKFVIGDLAHPDWVRSIAADAPFDLVVSRYAIHHLTDQRKRELYGEIFERLLPGGMFINVEHVVSRTPWIESLSDELMIDSIHAFQTSQGSDKPRTQLAEEFYARPDKAANILAPVEQQCQWLREIGFADVDCYFKVFELAVFGGRRSV